MLEHFPFLRSEPQASACAVSRRSMRREGRSTRYTKTGTALVLRHGSNDGLCWVAWANLFARAYPIADTGKLSLAHATHQITFVGAREPR